MKKHFHYSWVILIGTCIMMSMGGMCFNSVGVFFPEIANALSVTDVQVSTYLTIQCLSSILGMYVVGRLIGRDSVKYLLSIASLVITLCFVFLSYGTAIWQWYVIAIPLGLACGFICPVPIGILINNWFEKKRGFASGVAYAFSGIMGAILSPIATNIIIKYGWRTAYRVYAAIPIVLLLPIAIFLIEYLPENKGLLPYGADENIEALKTTGGNDGISFSKAKKRSIFYLIIVCAGIISVAGGFSQQFPNFAISIQFGSRIGSLMVTACMLTQLIANVPLGILCDRIGIAKAVIIYSATALAGCIILSLTKAQEFAFVGCVMYGIGMCQTMVIPPLVVREIFGNKDYARINSLVMMGSALFGSFSSTIYSGVAENMHSYASSLLIAAALYFIAIVLINIVMRLKQNNEGSYKHS